MVCSVVVGVISQWRCYLSACVTVDILGKFCGAFMVQRVKLMSTENFLNLRFANLIFFIAKV